MKVKRMVERLFAVTTGVAMLGATAMGAMAATNLKDYPTMFVTDGTFNGYFVVGENAAAIDNLAMTDIATSMYVAKAGVGSTTTTVEGDAWLVGTSSKKFEIANSNASTSSNQDGETIREINTFIGDEELDALADGTWETNEQNYDFQQFLFFDAANGAVQERNRIVKYAENDDSKTADFFYIANGAQIARYKMEFTSTAQSDITDSTGSGDATGTYLDDFEDTTFSILGKEYTVVQARRPNTGVRGGEDSIKLTLMGGAVRDTLLEGESKTYTIKGKTYDVTVSYVDDTTAKFVINGESTNKLKDGETFVLSDKTEVGVSEVLYQSYAGGIHSTTFFLGASKMEMRDDDITNQSAGSKTLKVGSEDIDGTTVFVTGTDDNSTFSISTIEVNMSSEDNFYVGAGEKLSKIIDAQDEEEQVLMDGGFDVEYKGLTTEDTNDLEIKTASTRRYKLKLFDGDGKQVDIPVAYAEAQFNLSFGEESNVNARGNDKRLIVNESHPIYKDDYFVLTDGTASDGSAKSYLLQYKGADDQTKSSPKIKFKNLGSGETLEYSVTTVSGGTTATVATIKLGGYSFTVHNASAATVNDFQVRVGLDGDGAPPVAEGNQVPFVDYYGSQWSFNAGKNTSSAVAADQWGNSNTPGVTGNGTTSNQDNIALTWNSGVNADDYDNEAPSTVVWNITATSDPEVRAALLSGLTLFTPDGETEVTYGYNSMGAFVKHKAPSGDPQEVIINYPAKQRLPQVYFTSGATSSSTKAKGDMMKVTVVDATKLDSEVASVSAQNLIVVGGPCVNTVAAELLGSPAVCTEGFMPGKARIKLFENSGKTAMLVAGYSGADTRLAGKVIAHRASELSGMEAVVEGQTYTDATISAPSVATTTTTTQ